MNGYPLSIRSNRTFMELKLPIRKVEVFESDVLIVPLWN